jgi:hypothetical protein
MTPYELLRPISRRVTACLWICFSSGRSNQRRIRRSRQPERAPPFGGALPTSYLRLAKNQPAKVGVASTGVAGAGATAGAAVAGAAVGAAAAALVVSGAATGL